MRYPGCGRWDQRKPSQFIRRPRRPQRGQVGFAAQLPHPLGEGAELPPVHRETTRTESSHKYSCAGEGGKMSITWRAVSAARTATERASLGGPAVHEVGLQLGTGSLLGEPHLARARPDGQPFDYRPGRHPAVEVAAGVLAKRGPPSTSRTSSMIWKARASWSA